MEIDSFDPKRRYQKPDTVKVTGSGHSLQISFCRFRLYNLGILLPLAIYWLLAFSAILGNVSVIDIIFFTVWILPLTGFTYLALAYLLNSVILTIEEDKLAVRFSPLPWWGAETLPINNIRKFIRYKKKIGGGISYRPIFEFEIWALLTNGKWVKVVPGIPLLEVAVYIKQEIEDFLAKSCNEKRNFPSDI